MTGPINYRIERTGLSVIIRNTHGAIVAKADHAAGADTDQIVSSLLQCLPRSPY